MAVKKYQIMKRTFIFMWMFILCILVSSYAIAKPDYDVETQLSDKSVSEGERFGITVYITGGGKCEDNDITIIAEGFINISDYVVTYSEDHEMPEKVPFYNEMSIGCQVDKDYKTGNVTLNQGYDSPHTIDIGLRSPYFSNEGFHEVQFIANLTPFHNAKGGDYDVQAVFTCLNGGDWYTFTNTETYHVKSLYEEWEVCKIGRA